MYALISNLLRIRTHHHVRSEISLLHIVLLLRSHIVVLKTFKLILSIVHCLLLLIDIALKLQDIVASIRLWGQLLLIGNRNLLFLVA
jgi:hypothetical protein